MAAAPPPGPAAPAAPDSGCPPLPAAAARCWLNTYQVKPDWRFKVIMIKPKMKPDLRIFLSQLTDNYGTRVIFFYRYTVLLQKRKFCVLRKRMCIDAAKKSQ